MNHSSDFTTTLATIAAKAAQCRGIDAETAVRFAWFSVGQVGDASIDAEDFTNHLFTFRKADRAGEL